jgi:hypothetical protein
MFRRAAFASSVQIVLILALSILSPAHCTAAPPGKTASRYGAPGGAALQAMTPPVVSAKGDTISAICLRQEGSLAGAESIFITADAIRIDNTARNVITVARAPDWTVTSYSPAAKRFCTTDINMYHGQLTHLFLFYGVNMAAYDFHLDHKTRFIEHPATVLKATANKKDTENTVVTNAFKFYIVADDAKIPTKAADVLARHLCVPSVHQLPLRLDYSTDNLTQRAINTTSWKKENIARTWFDIPSGYVRCNKESDVYMDESF